MFYESLQMQQYEKYSEEKKVKTIIAWRPISERNTPTPLQPEYLIGNYNNYVSGK